METIYVDGRISVTGPCQVRFEGTEVVLSYNEGRNHVVYRGTEDGPGHYRLVATEVRGCGTLHRFEGADELEGSWDQEKTFGMWKIQLEE